MPLILNTNYQRLDGKHTTVSYIPISPQYIPPETSKTRDLIQNYNQLLQSKRPLTGLDLEYLMLKKGEIIDSKIQMLLSEVYRRHLIKEVNLYEMSLDQCTCRNLIYLMGYGCLEGKRIELERKIIDLEQEKRQEKVGYFRDILFIKKELRESLIEKLEEDQKAMFLGKRDEESR